MPMTPYSDDNQRFSNDAHQQARIDIYPLLFGVPAERLTYEERPDAKERDLKKAIDRDIKIAVPGLRGDLSISVQERFREPRYAQYQDATITEFNHRSGMLGELYKIEAELMVYAYFNELTSRFIEAIAFWVAPLKVNIAKGNIQQESNPNPRSKQTFFCFKFDELESLSGVVAFRKLWNGADPEQRLVRRPSSQHILYKKTVKQTIETIEQYSLEDYWKRHIDPQDEEGA